ncbi:MAG: molecular chaperone DnaJ [Alphaproteobacteria bacterium]|nr:MAG: molecular chaperone DnaJ [Alphaproteobacteria bacterium]
MPYMFGFFLVVAIVTSAIAVMLTVPAERLARGLRLAAPAALIVIGVVLTIIGRGSIGLPLAAVGLTWFARSRGVSRSGGRASGARSTVRSALFEMELDHESGDLDGVVLTGRHEGRRLSSLSPEQLLALYDDTLDDPDSAQLLAAYLDRRIPGWRERTQTHHGTRQGGTPGAGPMTKEEAYQILGLAPGAGAQEVREAHRRLMKRLHPDSGGSTFLAAKINEAKDVLLD